MLSSKIGDVAHVVSLCSIAFFAFSVAFERFVFDAYWKERGFCTANPDTPYWTSHDLCLYADLFLGSVVGVVYLLLHKEPGMDQANDLVRLSVLGVIGHGIGHGAIAAEMRKGTSVDGQKTGWDNTSMDTPIEFMIQQAPFLLFWIALLSSAVPKATWPGIVGMSFASMALGFLIPTNLGFTYVQSILFLAFDVNEILRPREEKGFEYALYPLLVGIPTGIVGWIESTMCTKGVIDIGGHLIYDAYIPLSILAFYMISYVRTQALAQPKKKAA